MHVQPVHATGRYFYLSLVEILQREFGYPKVYSKDNLVPAYLSCTKFLLQPLID
jgi:hypothetical protein